VRQIPVKDCFTDSLLDVMNFLNEIIQQYPQAISFAPGRPLEEFFDVEHHLGTIRYFVSVTAQRSGISEAAMWRQLGQYPRTNGIINDLIAQHLEQDENIHVPPDAIMVTVGAQEAMAVILMGLFDPATDFLLVGDPAYIGMTGPARILGIKTFPVPSGDEGLNPAEVEKVIQGCLSSGRPKALYDVPDFNNPLGTVLSRERREQLLVVCKKYDMLLIEDNPYGMYIYEGEKIPTIKALDRDGSVLYIGSFSKTLFPGLRLGYLVADQRIPGTSEMLARELSKVKSLLTVSSSPLLQAIVGGVLLQCDGSLKKIIRPKVEQVRRNRDAMLQSLSTHLADMAGCVSWNRPKGGFFLTMKLPFPFGKEDLRICASDYGVIVSPMTFFSLCPGHENEIRLSFSYLDENGVRTGVERIARFVRDAVRKSKSNGSSCDLALKA
jgi:(S)-3,5-dihydroxyphenylglycine transaminase